MCYRQIDNFVSFNKQLKEKSLERIIPEIIKANDFIQEHLKKGKDLVDKKLLEIIKKTYSPIAQDLSKEYLI